MYFVWIAGRFPLIYLRPGLSAGYTFYLNLPVFPVQTLKIINAKTLKVSNVLNVNRYSSIKITVAFAMETMIRCCKCWDCT